MLVQDENLYVIVVLAAKQLTGKEPFGRPTLKQTQTWFPFLILARILKNSNPANQQLPFLLNIPKMYKLKSSFNSTRRRLAERAFQAAGIHESSIGEDVKLS